MGARLRELRASAFRSGSALARHLGWQQTKVSKLETGKQLPSAADLDAWVEAVKADEGVRAELSGLLTQARIQYSTWTDMDPVDIVATQAKIGATEASEVILRGYQPAMIPGILQTAAYARELLTIPGVPPNFVSAPEQIEALIAQRIKRQELLYQPNREVQIVIGEAALTVHFGTIGTLLGQLDRLVAITGLPSVDLRVLPRAVAYPIMPLTGFWLRDDVVRVETITGEQLITGPDDIAVYRRAFDLLREASVAEADAVALIQRAAAELRTDQPAP
ncbi:MAG: helix-turn-helix domain-containing protein [Pseudonocardiales bacterium]|nr:helix-turn-helix domain-containing protein [Pseudonocardiales bacterium]